MKSETKYKIVDLDAGVAEKVFVRGGFPVGNYGALTIMGKKGRYGENGFIVSFYLYDTETGVDQVLEDLWDDIRVAYGMPSTEILGLLDN